MGCTPGRFPGLPHPKYHQSAHGGEPGGGGQSSLSRQPTASSLANTASKHSTPFSCSKRPANSCTAVRLLYRRTRLTKPISTHSNPWKLPRYTGTHRSTVHGESDPPFGRSRPPQILGRAGLLDKFDTGCVWEGAPLEEEVQRASEAAHRRHARTVIEAALAAASPRTWTSSTPWLRMTDTQPPETSDAASEPRQTWSQTTGQDSWPPASSNPPAMARSTSPFQASANTSGHKQEPESAGCRCRPLPVPTSALALERFLQDETELGFHFGLDG